jgi:putative RecB family exonuclease
MTRYSHSKISTFEQCKYKYKLQYIDGIRMDEAKSVELFLGSMVHDSLEKLYKDLSFTKLLTKEELLAFYSDHWDAKWTDDITIVKEYSAQNYKDMGASYLSAYYDHYHPFDQMQVLGLETQDRLVLPDGNSYHVRIDRLGCSGDTYYVCDYKTNSSLMTQEQADADRQLAMYSIWVRKRFPDASRVVLMWHMLKFDREVTSERSSDELEALQAQIVDRIAEIESCTDFPTNVSALCAYCQFRSICPSFKHEYALEEKSAQEFKQDDGVNLVDEYDSVSRELKELDNRKEELKHDLIAFSETFGVDIVYGSEKKISVKETEKIEYPEDKDAFVSVPKETGVYDSVSQVSYSRLTSLIKKGEMDARIASLVSREKDYRISLSKRKDA